MWLLKNFIRIGDLLVNLSQVQTVSIKKDKIVIDFQPCEETTNNIVLSTEGHSIHQFSQEDLDTIKDFFRSKSEYAVIP